MMLIGIDPHKSTHTATAVEPDTNREVASIRIDATLQVPPDAELGFPVAAAPVGDRERRGFGTSLGVLAARTGRTCC